MTSIIRASCLPAAVILACTICSGCAEKGSPSRPLVQSGRIVVLGDSLAVSPTDEFNFPGVLQKRLKDAGLAWTVVNAGVRGETTAGGLRRVDRLLESQNPHILILALGANDGLRVQDAGRMSRNLDEIITRAKARRIEVLFCGMELPPIGMFGYGRAFRNVFSSLAQKHDLPFVPFLLEGVAMNRAMNGEDGIHPNSAGAERIAQTIWPHLERMLEQTR